MDDFATLSISFTISFQSLLNDIVTTFCDNFVSYSQNYNNLIFDKNVRTMNPVISKLFYVFQENMT